MRKILSDVCAFADGRVAVADLDLETYISTENMLPNKEGVTRSSGLPTVIQTQAYQTEDMKFADVIDPKGISKDVKGLGKWGNGDVEVGFESLDQLDDVMAIIEQAFKLQDVE